jgi:hypothetical protein
MLALAAASVAMVPFGRNNGSRPSHCPSTGSLKHMIQA